MIKKLISLIITSLFIFVGCSSSNNKTTEETNNTAVSPSYKETNTINNKKTIILSGSSYSNTKYVSLGNLLFFPDPNNNERLSILDISEDINKTTDNLIIDSFNYNVRSLSTDGNFIYFSSTSTNSGLYKLDYEKKEITKINDDISLDMIYKDDMLYYINLNDKKIYSYSIKNKEKKLLSNYPASNLTLNNKSIFYKNLSDYSKLYVLNIDDNSNSKLIDLSIDSFALHNNEIIFSNSNDNNYIYSLNLSTFETKKILSISVSSLKQFNDDIYFINSSSTSSLYKLIPSNEDSNFQSTEIFPQFVNNYYLNNKGLFIESASDLDNIKIIKFN